jgi:formylmethanofuran dehydrogenase subunit C
MYVLDIDDLREIARSVGSKTSNPESQFELFNHALYKAYGIELPKGLVRSSVEKFGDLVNSPLVFERAPNAILKRKVEEGEITITIKKPNALYRIAILSSRQPIRLDLTIDGSVGNFFAAGCNFEGTWRVNGHAENGLADKGYSGKIVVEGFATELAGQNNQATELSHGVDILVKKGCMERAMGQARGGSLVTFGAGYNSGLYMSRGILLDLGRQPGQLFGPGMVGGVIYSREGTTAGEGASIAGLDGMDFEIIKQTLGRFEGELGIEGLPGLSIENPKIWLTNGISGREEYNFKTDFVKIVPKSPS